MNVKRTLTLGVAGGALVVWLAAAATSPLRPSVPLAVTPPAAVDRSGAELSAEIARLRERLRPSAQPSQARNLFRYRAQSAARSAAAAAAGGQDSALSPQPAPQAAPSPSDVVPLRLVGMAEDAGDAGPVRTAILSGFGDLFIVKSGDSIAGRYRVAAISADSIDLVDVGTNAPLRIPVK